MRELILLYIIYFSIESSYVLLQMQVSRLPKDGSIVFDYGKTKTLRIMT